MPQLRKAIPTPLGINADVWRLEAMTLRRAGKVVVEVNGFLAGASQGADAVKTFTDTLPPASAALVRQATKAQMETTALVEWGKMREDFADAVLEP